MPVTYLFLSLVDDQWFEVAVVADGMANDAHRAVIGGTEESQTLSPG